MKRAGKYDSTLFSSFDKSILNFSLFTTVEMSLPNLWEDRN